MDAKNWDRHAIEESLKQFPLTASDIEPQPMPDHGSVKMVEGPKTCGSCGGGLTDMGYCANCNISWNAQPNVSPEMICNPTPQNIDAFFKGLSQLAEYHEAQWLQCMKKSIRDAVLTK